MYSGSISELPLDSILGGSGSTGSSGIAAAIAAGAVLLIALVCLIAAVIALVCYIFRSVSLMQVAKRRGIEHAWLAWIPVGNLWVLGNISDQYQFVAQHKTRNFRLLLLIGGLISKLYNGISGVGKIAALISALRLGSLSLSGLVGTSLIGSLVDLVTIATAVLTYISYYDYYRSCRPDNATLYLVLSIIFPVSIPFFLFACRKRDEGMPPAQPVPADPEI